MIHPSPTELLQGVAATLRDSVSVTLPHGETRNQVRAAAAILRRLAVVWDRVVPAVEAENRDILETLEALGGEISLLGVPSPCGDEGAADPGEGQFESAARINRALQEKLEAIHGVLAETDDQATRVRVEAVLRDLYLRNLGRDRELSGRA